MEQFKKAKVVLIPTEKYSNIILNHNNKLQYNNTKYIKSYQQLLIISDDEIKEGDWYFDGIVFIHQKSKRNYALVDGNKQARKVIASYPPLKRATGEIYPEWEYQPQPSQQFIEQYIESYNRGEVITDVLVEYEEQNKKQVCVGMTGKPSRPLYSWIGDWNLKINPDNTITITTKPVKDNWNREEVIEILKQYTIEMASEIKNYHRDEWIKQNL